MIKVKEARREKEEIKEKEETKVKMVKRELEEIKAEEECKE